MLLRNFMQKNISAIPRMEMKARLHSYRVKPVLLFVHWPFPRYVLRVAQRVLGVAPGVSLPQGCAEVELLGVSSRRQWHRLFVPRCVLMFSKVASYSLGLTTTVRWSWKEADKSLREQGRGAHSMLVCKSVHGAVMESLYLLNSFRSLPWEACWGPVNEAALIFNNWNSVCDGLW